MLNLSASNQAFATLKYFSNKQQQGARKMMSVAALKRKDEKGYTLQTLIVTAVLVVLAIGVTVVIVSLTRSANDSTEDAASEDMAPREAQYGVILEDGSLSYDWRCGLHQEFVFGQGETHGRCQDRCWGTLTAEGKVKWDILFNSNGVDLPDFDPTTDFNVTFTKTKDGYGSRTAATSAYNALTNEAKARAHKAFFTSSDFGGGILYSERQPAGSHPLRSNGTVIALEDSCILTQNICSFSELPREAIIRRWEASVQNSLGDAGPPVAPKTVDILRLALQECV